MSTVAGWGGGKRGCCRRALWLAMIVALGGCGADDGPLDGPGVSGFSAGFAGTAAGGGAGFAGSFAGSAGFAGGAGSAGFGAGGSSTFDPDAGCGASSVIAEQVVVEKEIIIEEEITETQPVALYIVLDQSLSMQTGGLWDPAKTAIKSFVNDPSSAGVDVALEYFPPVSGDSGQCSGSGYDDPRVAMGRLPAHADMIAASLDSYAKAGGWGTPIEGALRGATTFCKNYQAMHAPEKCVAVLVTDGKPQLGCSEDYDTLAGIAGSAFTDDDVRTFAVGLSGADFSLLDEIAKKGGAVDCDEENDKRFACDVSAGASQLSDALAKIREVVTTVATRTETMTTVEETPLPCEWEIPEPTQGKSFDKQLVNIELSAPSLPAMALGQVSSQQACAERGWHYDSAQTPTRIVACEQTCDLIQSTDQAQIDILLGCQTMLLE